MRCFYCWRMCLWQYDRQCACSTMERQPNCALMFAYTSTHLPQTLHRTWRPFCIACSITCLKPLWFLLVGASEKHYVQWACSWCSDPSTACPCSLWCYSDTARQIRTSEAIHDATSCTRALYSMEATSNICCDIDGIQAMYCVPGLFVWCCSAVPSTVETMYFRIWTFMLHFQSGITHWSSSVDLKLTLYSGILILFPLTNVE